MKKEIIVIGGGASGLMAAITAARNGCKVTVLEKTNRVGNKLSITGNGKCNFTNDNQSISCYHSSDMKLANRVLQQFPLEKTVAFFQQLGVVSSIKNGYYYPYSEQATQVTDALHSEAKRLGVKLACNILISEIAHKRTKSGRRFCISTQNAAKEMQTRSKQNCNKADCYCYEADALIVAAGSKAASFTGSDGSGYEIASSLGHSLIAPVPALVQLLSNDKDIQRLAGLRIKGAVHLLIDGKEQASDQGEIQFIKNGLSGIPIFQVSYLASQALNRNLKAPSVCVELNLLPQFSEQELRAFLEQRREDVGYKTLPAFLSGLFHEKMIQTIKTRMKIKGEAPLQSYQQQQIEQLIHCISHLRFSIVKTHSFEHAQVCAGGVPLCELQADTLESKYVSSLYFAGEILDVDGICGGYNLQWAWASGYAAGLHAACDSRTRKQENS